MSNAWAGIGSGLASRLAPIVLTWVIEGRCCSHHIHLCFSSPHRPRPHPPRCFQAVRRDIGGEGTRVTVLTVGETLSSEGSREMRQPPGQLLAPLEWGPGLQMSVHIASTSPRYFNNRIAQIYRAIDESIVIVIKDIIYLLAVICYLRC